MKVEINSAALADAVAWTTRVIDTRPSNPILAGIKLEAIDGTLQLSAFNYEISARHHIEAGVDESGAVLVLGKLLADITKSLPAEKTYLATNESTMTITSGKSTFTLQLMPAAEYPDLPGIPPKLGQVDAPTFVQAVAQACVAVSREENRPVLTGVRMQFDGDKVIMTSTDRFRLSRASFTWTPQDENVSTTTLVRGSLLRDVARSLDEHQNVVLDFDTESPSLLGFENAGRTSTSQLIDGEFPAVDRLFADEYPIQAIINRTLLIDAIKRVALVAERNAPIRMAFSGQELTLSAGAVDEAQAIETLDIDMDGDEITVAFNPSYLIEGLSAITEPFVRMKMTTPVKPVEFNGQQESDSDESMDYRYLLVPMRFNS
ncbi:DNA polymerase III subunit beta [Bifidobacterium sp. UTCIF-37]|uniref:DNA polymerase III subunit beta n=1 Tax=unclassified Bifidobacterium TaxID=2608897 RepID=UPI00112AC174|nr:MULTISPECIES: DNA polymerase III subunit beta [unclassified Bifidobacterium]TPF85936.1 DNA polymerase III subunit beta [Bifidobacterium sp. UTCIF-37]TPF89093.1 DNA polymerase III subunit beta [Bifidobacterium sp. UTCIF-38]